LFAPRISLEWKFRFSLAVAVPGSNYPTPGTIEEERRCSIVLAEFTKMRHL
jgi:hypothetical protein